MKDTLMLWERTTNIWSLNQIFSNSSMRLYSYDLSQKSEPFWFNDKGRSVVLDAAIQQPWAPPGSPNLVSS